MKTFYYYPDIWNNEAPNIEYAYKVVSNRDIDAVGGGYDEWEVEWLIEDMAKDYFRNHDGWEVADSWHGSERTFAVWDEDKNLIGQFEVTLEYEPTFSAMRKK